MGCCGSSDARNLMRLEREVLSWSKLPDGSIEQLDVEVGKEPDGTPITIHTITFGSRDKPVLVYVHGYGGSGAMQFLMYRQLAKYFRVYMIDVIGMGASSRASDFDAETTEMHTCLNYMVSYIEKWRAAIGLTGFYLAGHSFGGHQVGHYTLRYPQHVKKLLLLSAIGIKSYPEDKLSEDAIMDDIRAEDPARANSWFFTIARSAWRNEYAAFRLVRCCGCCARGRVQGFIRARLKPTEEQEDILTDYLMTIFQMPGTTEVALYKLFALALRARFGLDTQDRLLDPSFITPFSILFGDDDWVKTVADRGASPELITKKRAQLGDKPNLLENNYNYVVLPEAGHNLHMDNPIGLSNFIINECLLGTEYLSEALPVQATSRYPENYYEQLETSGMGPMKP